METISIVSAIKEYFSTPEKPVTTDELKALGVQGIKELAPACAEALGKKLKHTGSE